MKHPSLYLDWYIHVPKVKHDFRSSGIAFFTHTLNLSDVDLSINYDHGNPEAVKQLAQWYSVKQENVFISSEGASGQNSRVMRYLAEKNPKRKEAIVEYPTYEPLLRATQEHFPIVKRLERREKEANRLDADRFRRLISEKTGLLVLTNPHAPSGTTSDRSELREIMHVANEHGFYVLCDEIYAEFERKSVPTLFSIDPQFGIVTTSFTKAYGLGGLKLGTALAEETLVNELYTDVLNTVGNTPNIVQIVSAKLLAEAKEKLEKHKKKWLRLKKETETRLNEMKLHFFQNKVGVTYWVRLPIRDSYEWINEYAIPKWSLAVVPGTFFLFRNNYRLFTSSMMRLGIGLMDPESRMLEDALSALEKALKEHRTRARYR